LQAAVASTKANSSMEARNMDISTAYLCIVEEISSSYKQISCRLNNPLLPLVFNGPIKPFEYKILHLQHSKA
jgi:hypothetical protein